MPYYSTFWDRHYKDIGNCCMTFPLEDIKLDYKKTQYTAADCIDVGWMKDKRLKWFGWDNNGNTSWTTPDGMIYHVKDLKRNELGEAYEKEVDEIRDVPMEDPTKGFSSTRDFYEYEVEAQSKCQFCQRPGISGDRGGGKDIEDKDSSSFKGEGGPVKENTDWQQYAQSNSDPTGVINNEYVKEPQKYVDQYGPKGGPEGKDKNPYIPPVPYAPPVPLPTPTTSYTPPTYAPPPIVLQPENPVTKRSKVTDTVDTTTSPALNVPWQRRKLRYIVQPDEDFVGTYDPEPQEKKEKYKKECNPNNWLEIASKEIGQNRAPIGQNNPEIVKYFDFTNLKGTALGKSDKTSWCGAFVNYCLVNAGITGNNSARVSDFLTFGKRLNEPALGAIVILKYSHVAFVIGKRDDGRIVILGGNQGPAPNGVNISSVEASDIKEYRYPTSCEPNYDLPTYKFRGHSLNYQNTR